MSFIHDDEDESLDRWDPYKGIELTEESFVERFDELMSLAKTNKGLSDLAEVHTYLLNHKRLQYKKWTTCLNVYRDYADGVVAVAKCYFNYAKN